MKFTVTKGALETFRADVVAIGCFESEKGTEKKPKPAVLQKGDGGIAVNHALNGQLVKLIEAEEFTGAEGRQKVLFTAGMLPARYVILAGLGKKKEFTADTLRRAAGSIAKAVNDVKGETLAMVFARDALGGIKTAVRMQSVVEGIILGTYSFDSYKKDEDKQKKTLKTVYFLNSGNPKQYESSILKGQAIADATNMARDMGNTPGLDLTPSVLAKKAKEVAVKGRLAFDLMNEEKIKAENMNAFYSTAKGSDEPPVFIRMTYRPARKAKAKVAIVGKGITFDAGGISLKPPRGMEQMKDDMAGAAAVISVMQAVAVLKPQVAVDAFIPACENMPSGRAIKPGDIVKARNGKTIEIISTDAEGRMILADALSYASDKKPDFMIDLATLTGACAYAVGEKYIAVLGNDQRLIDKLKKSGEGAGEPLWQLPLEREYKKGLTKGIADLKNVGSSKADTINGALFLEEFVGETKWAHLDIASTSWSEEEKPFSPRGSTGAGVRLLLYFLLGL
jgi:leucyl aminopeptidase